MPPEGWLTPFAIDQKTFKFNTRVQSINELQRSGIIAAKSRRSQKKVLPFPRTSTPPGDF